MKHTLRTSMLVLAVMVLAASISAALTKAQSILISKGTIVNLVFDQSLNSKTTKVGDHVRFHVAQDVLVSRRTVISRGTRVTGVVSLVSKRQRYGINAKMRIDINPVTSVSGSAIPIEARSKGEYIGGKTGQAAGATVGGAIILGPIGLVGGYFVSGKRVIVKSGDPLATEVSRTVMIRR